MEINKIKNPFSFIMFGASGDLARVMLFPALYELALQRRFPKKYTIYGFARSNFTDTEFRKLFRDSVIKKVGKDLNKTVLNDLLKKVFYHQGQYDQMKDYEALTQKMKTHRLGATVQNMAYLSIPPKIIHPVVENLAGIRPRLKNGIQIILEKPFGTDEKSATELFHFVSSYFEEKDVFLLDHYLGKTAVRSILTLRYTNTILDMLLKGKVISNIQISALETVGVGKRIGYFEDIGIVKDMIQSHLLQILALATMALPLKRDSSSVLREKINVLSALRYSDPPCGLVLGQYENYKFKKGVKKGSKTPTFAAVRFFIDLIDWYKVPIYIRTGKKLNHKHTYLVIEFKKQRFLKGKDVDSNKLIIELYPKEKIQIRLVNQEGKVAGRQKELMSTESLACAGDECLGEHGRLILEAFLGDRTYFLSFEEIIASWKFVDRLMACATEHKTMVIQYESGSEGPKQQHELTRRDKFKWYDADA